MVSLVCPRCNAALDTEDTKLRCTNCEAVFPVVDGIPRLLERDFYWGEIEQADARRLVDDAKANGWRAAVTTRFKPSDAASLSIMDWQRASWIPLLGLPKESVVLDVGSGYGAITHALAAHFDEVHSVEAIPERVEFTRTRLTQEQHDNVTLVQGSALQLPYAPGSFDAIIVNGVLEWIGDWDLEGDPRSAQLRFLRRLHSLLKPEGRLLVGIENRLAYASLTGVLDHSGLPYTNLLPRPLATAAMRVFANRHHRMVAPARSYRTYTYSERGFYRLFADAQFDASQSYWAEPGYNQPYRLVPLTDESVEQNLAEMQTEAKGRGSESLAARAKRFLAKAGLFRPLVPEFVFILRKTGAEAPRWDSLPPELRTNPQFRLTTQKYGTKTTIRVSTKQHPGVVLKYSTPAPGSKQRVAAEYAELERVASALSAHPAASGFEVSAPLGTFTAGNQLVTSERNATGEHVYLLLYRLPADQRLAFLQKYLPRIAEVAASIAKLSAQSAERETADSWLEHSKPLVPPKLAARIAEISQKYSMWSGHGDFNLENLLLDLDTNRLTVIDWEYVRTGLPPLYDLFTLFYAVVNVVVPAPRVLAKISDPNLAQFYTAFFDENEWSALLKSSAERARNALGIEAEEMWDLFVDALILRIGYLIERKSVFSESRISFMGSITDWRDQFQL